METKEYERPDSQQLLLRLQLEEEEKLKKTKGKLKIFLGYAAGSGKTYAMLTAAHEAKKHKIDVVAGYIEPHDRPDTQALVEGLETIAPMEVVYKGVKLREFNLDAALKRNPRLILVDELAHTNVKGCRNEKRYQDVLGEEYIDYNLVMATTFGNPIGTGAIRGQLKKLIEEHNLPPVVFHSLRHSSVTYKLKLNGGDIKAVQGDSGHSQVDMVTDVYSHIIDEDRRRNAELFEEAFYEKKNLDPKMREETTTQTVDVPDDVDAELLAKVLANPEMKALLASLAKAMK